MWATMEGKDLTSVHQGSTFSIKDLGIASLLFADDMVLLAWWAAEWEAVEMRVNTS